jgi:hypothetical protein
MRGGNLKLIEVPSTLSKLREQVSFTYGTPGTIVYFCVLISSFSEVRKYGNGFEQPSG